MSFVFSLCEWATKAIPLWKEEGKVDPLVKGIDLLPWFSIVDDGEVCGWNASFYSPHHFKPKPFATRMFSRNVQLILSKAYSKSSLMTAPFRFFLSHSSMISFAMRDASRIYSTKATCCPIGILRHSNSTLVMILKFGCKTCGAKANNNADNSILKQKILEHSHDITSQNVQTFFLKKKLR